jgi:hypothetical protein
MSSQTIVLSKTDHIIVEPAGGAVAITNAGPPGPPGPPTIPPGGTTGQVLAKLSDNDYDVGWVTP